MRIYFNRKTKGAECPKKTYKTDACYDVVATSVEAVAPNIYRYGLGLAFEIDRNSLKGELPEDAILYIDFRPRSSVWKTGMVLSNCEGTIDELYRGEVAAVFFKVVDYGEPYRVGDRIGQIKLGFSLPVQWEEKEGLSATERGEGGYGSTGR